MAEVIQRRSNPARSGSPLLRVGRFMQAAATLRNIMTKLHKIGAEKPQDLWERQGASESFLTLQGLSLSFAPNGHIRAGH